MNFQNLPPIEKSQTYLDRAISKAKGRCEAKRATLTRKDVERTKIIEGYFIEVVSASLNESFHKILKSFPSFESLTSFYHHLVRCTLPYARLKKSLGTMDWTVHKVSELSHESRQKIKNSKNEKDVHKAKFAFLGRIGSVMKQINPYLQFLDEARKTMRGYPSIKSDIFTVCLFGFPNVGKTTLFAKMTGSTPEIKNYAFTTRRLNVSYIYKDGKRNIQLIDTPGTLNRFEVMNDIERQADLAVKYCAHEIVFIFDPTDNCAKSDQVALLKKVKGEKKKVTVFISKTDLKKMKMAGAIDNVDTLLKVLEKQEALWAKKFISVNIEESPKDE